MPYASTTLHKQLQIVFFWLFNHKKSHNNTQWSGGGHEEAIEGVALVLVVIELEVSAEAEVDTVAFGQLQGGTAGHMLDAIVPALFVDVTDLIFVLVEDHASIVVVRNASRGETEVVDTVNGSGENACVREEIENKHTHTNKHKRHTHSHFTDISHTHVAHSQF